MLVKGLLCTVCGAQVYFSCVSDCDVFFQINKEKREEINKEQPRKGLGM